MADRSLLRLSATLYGIRLKSSRGIMPTAATNSSW